MTAQDAFIRKIVEEPFENSHRLVYADWMDEQDDEELANRAWWIRHFITGHTRPYDAEAIKKSINIIHGEPPGSPFPRRVLWGPTNLLGIKQCWSFDRGFVAEVRTNLATLFGSPCGECSGPDDGVFAVNAAGRCEKCDGKKIVPGVARELFLSHPITGVQLTGKVADAIAAERCWIRERPGLGSRYLSAVIPADVFAELKGGRPECGGVQWVEHFSYDDGWMIYPNDLAANKALSRAVVDRCRQIAELPELEWPDHPTAPDIPMSFNGSLPPE